MREQSVKKVKVNTSLFDELESPKIVFGPFHVGDHAFEKSDTEGV
jgi:hypothetical protein